MEILRENGFQVREVSEYESLFKMVAGKRFDLFCRGTNELLSEWETHKSIVIIDSIFSTPSHIMRMRI